MISLILAMDQNNLIGREGKLPWRLPADLAYFKKTTMGRTVIMGRKTYESIGRPLPGRKNVVVTRDKQYSAPGCELFHSIEEILSLCGQNKEEVFIIGGAKIYKEFLPYAHKIYITFIKDSFTGNEFFPHLALTQWRLISENKGETNQENPYEFYFRVYERIE